MRLMISLIPVLLLGLTTGAAALVPDDLANMRACSIGSLSPDGDSLIYSVSEPDLEAGAPMDPHRSLVRIASISKTMTFTGLMQLVEQGRVDLAEDLRAALPDVKIEDRFGPLTPWHLMTHTPGYEDSYLGHFFARDLSQDYAPADYLARFAPRRVRPPGEMTSYSNFGVALAGHLVAVRSGEVFEAYSLPEDPRDPP